jgi:glycosyltransferase involved in cell wall biosynthesis
MRILVISSHEQHYGGGEGRLAFEFALEMSKRHHVVLMYPGEAPEKPPAGMPLEVFPIRSIDYTLPALTGGEIRAIFRFLDSFRPDIIHSHTPWFLGSIIQAWAFLKGVPFYFTGHELPSKILEWGLVRYLRGVAQTGLLHMLTRTYLVTFCRHCTAVVALNAAAASDIRAIGYRGRLHIIPNGRTIALYDGKPLADLGGRERILTFVGDFYPRKNQKFLVAMLRHLPPQYRLLLIGHEVDHRYRREIDAAMGPELRQRVTFTGKVDHSLIPDYLAKTHLWVSASLMEVQSLAVLEALASGTPVLGLSNETIDEMVDERVGMRLEKGATPEGFARAVRALCEMHPEEYARICGNARMRARPYDWAHATNKTEAMYRLRSARDSRARRGVVALPLLLAGAQILLANLMYLLLRIVSLSNRLEQAWRSPGRWRGVSALHRPRSGGHGVP